MNITIKKTAFNGFGVKKTNNGLYFAVALDYLSEGGIRFYDVKTKKLVETVVFTDDLSFGNVYSVLIEGLNSAKLVYRYFCDKEEFADPYSTELSGLEAYGKEASEKDIYSVISDNDVYNILSDDKMPGISFEDTIIYLTHVRGATMLDKSVKHKGTFLGLTEKIEYYKYLGITSLMLMPCYDFIEREDLSSKSVAYNYKSNPDTESKINYWGFEKGYYFAPKSGYASSNNPCNEFASLIKELHLNNLELIMMMYYPDGTSMELINDSLRFYVEKYHVDGFRLMGTAIDVDRITSDPFLKRTKLFFENIEAGRFWQEKNVRFKNIGLYSSIFMDRARSFLKSDEDQVSYYSFAIRENNKNYSQVRYISDYSGFTLNDLVSYNKKYNEANGEDNQDGTNYNHSWNCGCEGPTKKTSVNKLRMQQAMNGMLLSMLCQGTPQLRGGDECLNSCMGNNNPWCQDNETGWITYSKNKTSKEFEDFTRNLIAFRKRHIILHQPGELKMFDYMSCRLPDISFHGEEAYRMNQDPDSREFSILYAGDYAKQFKKAEEDSLFIVFNLHWEKREFCLPVADKNKEWRLLFTSDKSTPTDFDESKAELYEDTKFIAPGRTISIFLLRKIK